jgi:ATP-binding cassette subfamily C (CFTR/MRP) protein 10
MILHLLLQDLHNKVLVTLLIVLSLTATLAGRTKDQMCRMQMNRVGGMLQAVIYSHGLKLSPESRSVYPAGKIITLMTNDVEFLKNYVFKIHDIWSSPLQLAVIMLLVVFLIGSSGFYGMSCHAMPHDYRATSLANL